MKTKKSSKKAKSAPGESTYTVDSILKKGEVVQRGANGDSVLTLLHDGRTVAVALTHTHLRTFLCLMKVFNLTFQGLAPGEEILPTTKLVLHERFANAMYAATVAESIRLSLGAMPAVKEVRS